jgi:hypothetical protein
MARTKVVRAVGAAVATRSAGLANLEEEITALGDKMQWIFSPEAPLVLASEDFLTTQRWAMADVASSSSTFVTATWYLALLVCSDCMSAAAKFLSADPPTRLLKLKEARPPAALTAIPVEAAAFVRAQAVEFVTGDLLPPSPVAPFTAQLSDSTAPRPQQRLDHTLRASGGRESDRVTDVKATAGAEIERNCRTPSG